MCYKDEGIVVTGFGIITNAPIKCPDEYRCTKYKYILPVHMLSTSLKTEITLEHLSESLGYTVEHCPEQSDYLPKNVYNLATNVSETIDLDIPEVVSVEYEKQVLYSHMFMAYLREIASHETPVPVLEQERRKRILGINYHMKTKKSLKFPPTRRASMKPNASNFDSVMRLHAKYASMFSKLLKPIK